MAVLIISQALMLCSQNLTGFENAALNYSEYFWVKHVDAKRTAQVRIFKIGNPAERKQASL